MLKIDKDGVILACGSAEEIMQDLEKLCVGVIGATAIVTKKDPQEVRKALNKHIKAKV